MASGGRQFPWRGCLFALRRRRIIASRHRALGNSNAVVLDTSDYSYSAFIA